MDDIQALKQQMINTCLDCFKIVPAISVSKKSDQTMQYKVKIEIMGTVLYSEFSEDSHRMQTYTHLTRFHMQTLSEVSDEGDF